MKRIEVIFKLDNKQAKRVVRGGAWRNAPVGARVASRLRNHSDLRNLNVGFRMAQER